VADRRRAPKTKGTSRCAIRAAVAGAVQGVGFREATRRRAHELGVLGWVRNTEEGTVAVHAEGTTEAVAGLVAFLHEGPRGASVLEVAVQEAAVEGHEQFAIGSMRRGPTTSIYAWRSAGRCARGRCRRDRRWIRR
jgi:acylphosphatase